MANIDIKKLFVKVAVSNDTTKLAWDNAVLAGSLDAAKIYFLDNGTLYVPFVNKYYGVSDSTWEKINKDITDEIARAKAAEEALSGRLDVVEGDGEGSINKAVKDAVDKIMGGEDIQQSLDTIKEISEWINDPDDSDGLQGFLAHVAEFNTHVEAANTRMDNIEADIEANKNSVDEKLSKFINGGEKDSDNFVTTFPAGITINGTSVANFKEYVDAQKTYDTAQDGWVQANSDAINTERNRAIDAEGDIQEELTEHKSHNHVFFNEKHPTTPRNILWLNQNDAIFGYGGQTALEDPSKDSIGNMTGKSGMIIELSKYNVVDIADPKFHTNINVASADNEATIDDIVVSSNDDGIHTVKTGKTVPGVKINDSYTIATRNELVALNKSINDKLNTKSDALETRVANNEDILAGLGVHVAEGETAEYDTVINAIDGKIDSLTKDATSTSEDGEGKVTVTMSEAAGIVSIDNVNVTYAKLTDTELSEGIVDSATLKSVIDTSLNNLWEDFVAK